MSQFMPPHQPESSFGQPHPFAAGALPRPLTALPAQGLSSAQELLQVLTMFDNGLTAMQVAEAWPAGTAPLRVAVPQMLANLGYQVRACALPPRRCAQGWHLLMQGQRGTFQLHAPDAQGRLAPPPTATGAQWLIQPPPQAGQPLPPPGALLWRFRHWLGPLVGFSLGIQLLGLLVPVLTMIVYDRVIGSLAPVGYGAMVSGMLLALAAEGLFRHLRGRLLTWIVVRWDYLAANLVVGQLLHLPAAMIENAAVSSQLGRLKGFDAVRELATSPLILGILDLPFIVVLLLAISAIGGPLVWIPLLLLAVYLGLFVAALPWVRRTLAAAARAHEECQRLLLETCQQLGALRTDGLADIWQQRLQTAGLAAGVRGVRSAHMHHLLEIFSQFTSSLAGLATLALGVHLVLGGQMSAGALVASMMLVWRVLAPFGLLCTSLPRLVQLQQVLGQLRLLLALPAETPVLAPPPLRELDPAHTFAKSAGTSLQVQHVSLRYGGTQEPALSNLTFTLEPGQLGVIGGRNGSGKSSLLKLVLGLYQPQAGMVRLNGQDVRQWHPERLRQGIAYLPQQPELFSGSVAFNLRLAAPLASDEQVWQALREAGAENAVRQLPEGLNTELSPGTPLPQLLRYQLSLARLFLRSSPLVLCDELPNAVLATPLGAVFQAWLQAQRGRRTVLLVSHRDDFFNMADLAIALRAEEPPLVGNPLRVRQALEQLQQPVQPAPAHASLSPASFKTAPPAGCHPAA